MGLETATLIHELDPANPVGASDPKAQGDNHIRMLKSAIQNTLPNVDGVVTSSHTELNKLTGATVSTAELNKLTGVTATTAELNKLAGLTATTAELNKLAGTAAGLTAAELSILDGLTATTAELNKLAGVAAGLTAAELSFVDGVTSAIQTQLNALTAALATTGTYTPTITGTANLDSTTPRLARWIRVGNHVFVSGTIILDPTGTSSVFFSTSLPIASNFANTFDGSGSGAFSGNPITAGIGIGNVANDRIDWVVANNTTTGVEFNYNFSYVVI